MSVTKANEFKSRLLQSTVLVACVACAGSAQAQTANTTGANVNVLNLLSPYLGLNASAIGQATLQGNLAQAITTNNGATLAQQQLAISDKNLLNNASNAVTGLSARFGVAANLAGGLPAQAPIGGITPQQQVGGFGAVLGPIYQAGVANGASGPLSSVVTLLTTTYNSLTSADIGVAKNYFANGAATNPSTTPPNYVPIPAVAPAGFTLPTFNGLPNTTNSVYDLAYGVTNTQPNQDVYGSSRPAQVSSQVNLFDPTALAGINTNPSFPSGHTTYAFTDSLLLAIMVPELYQSMLSRAAEYGNSRIVLGVHYPLDIIASRSLVSYELAQALSNPAYINNPSVTGTSLNVPTLLNQASTQLRAYLSAQCGNTVAACATSTANTTNDPYAPSAANQAIYQQRLTYGLPTLTFDQAPREAAPAGGPDASILLATVYGGSTSAAKLLAPTGGLLGNLSTSTVNQIIVNTETNALAAFFGTSLSYWSRIDLYTASTYFQNVTGTLTLASSDVVNTNVTVGAGGKLVGTGTVGSTTVSSGGALQPGAGVAGGALTVNGSLAFQSGALYIVQVSSSATASITATGTAALAGAVRVVSPDGSFRFNQPAAILTSAGLNGTRFDTLTTPTGINGSLAYSGTTVSLNLTSGLGQIAGLNGNQRAVGFAIDAALNAGATSSGLNAIFAGNTAQNLTQAAGQTATGAQQTTFNAMTQFMGVVSDPFAGSRGETAVPAAARFADDDEANAYTATERKRSGSERDAYGMITKAPPRAAVFEPRWNVWVAGFGGSQTTDGNAITGSGNTTSRIGAAAVGADYRLSPTTVAGFALAGGGTDFRVDGQGSGRSDLFQAGGFVRHTQGTAYITGAAAYAWQNITTDRTVTIAGIDQLHANFNANALSGRLEGGNRYILPAIGGIGLTPYAAVQVTAFDLPSYAESVVSGANTFALTYNAKTATDTRSELGLRSDKSFAVNDAVLTLRGRAAWAHDFATDRSVSATFQTLPGASFVVNGAAQGRDAALTTASAEMKFLSGISLAATFEGEFSDVTRSYAGKGSVRYAW